MKQTNQIALNPKLYFMIKNFAKGKPMIQLPRPSTVNGNPGGPAGNNPPKK